MYVRSTNTVDVVAGTVTVVVDLVVVTAVTNTSGVVTASTEVVVVD